MGRGWSLLPLLLLLFATSARTEGRDDLRASVRILPQGFSAMGISPDGSAVLGRDAGVGGGAIWRRGRIWPLERDPTRRRSGAFAHASSWRARVVLDVGLDPVARPVFWRRGRLGELPGFGEARDISRDGRIVVGFWRYVTGRRSAVRWVRGRPLPLRGDAFEAHTAESVSADGATVLGSGRFRGGPLSRYLWQRERVREIEGHPDAVAEQPASLGPSEPRAMELSADGTTAVHHDVVAQTTVCTPVACRTEIDVEAWRWREGRVEPLRETTGGASFAGGVTANGEVVVGRADLSDGTGPFLWDPTHRMRSLTGLLEELGADLGDLVLQHAIALSDDGRRIVLSATRPGPGRRTAVGVLAILPPACSDRVDNDGDGHVDHEDGGCRGPRDRSEQGPTRSRRPFPAPRPR